MRCLNKVMLIGRVGKNPIINTSDRGIKFLNFTLCTTSSWIDKLGNKKEAIEWHKISCFGPLIEIFEKYVKTGSALYVEGAIKTNQWKDKSGIDRKDISINANNLIVMPEDGRNANTNGNVRGENQEDFMPMPLPPAKSMGARSYSEASQGFSGDDEDDVPF